MREREERRRNVILKGVEVKDGKRKKAVEEILKVLKVKAEMEKIRRLGGEEGKNGEMLLVKLKGEEQKRDYEKEEAVEG